MDTNQIGISHEATAWGVNLLPINVQTELKSLQAHIKELNEKLSKKDSLITWLREDREILIDENERLDKGFRLIRDAHQEQQKRKLLMLK